MPAGIEGFRPDSLGYGFGMGAAVTQETNRTTAVTCNALCGLITMVSAAGSTTGQSFTVNNRRVNADDAVIVWVKSGTDPRRVNVVAVADGSFVINTATLSGTTTETPVLGFMVLKNDIL